MQCPYFFITLSDYCLIGVTGASQTPIPSSTTGENNKKSSVASIKVVQLLQLYLVDSALGEGALFRLFLW